MSGAHEGCSQGKSVRDREGSKHSTAATLERVDSQAAVLPQAFKDRVHARQLAGVVQESGAKDESSRFGTLTFNMTHASERGAAARKSHRVTRIAGVEKFVGSRFTPTCNTSILLIHRPRHARTSCQLHNATHIIRNGAQPNAAYWLLRDAPVCRHGAGARPHACNRVKIALRR